MAMKNHYGALVLSSPVTGRYNRRPGKLDCGQKVLEKSGQELDNLGDPENPGAGHI